MSDPPQRQRGPLCRVSAGRSAESARASLPSQRGPLCRVSAGLSDDIAPLQPTGPSGKGPVPTGRRAPCRLLSAPNSTLSTQTQSQWRRLSPASRLRLASRLRPASRLERPTPRSSAGPTGAAPTHTDASMYTHAGTDNHPHPHTHPSPRPRPRPHLPRQTPPRHTASTRRTTGV